MQETVNKYNSGKKFLFYLLLAIIFILTCVIYESVLKKRTSPEKISENFQAEFLQADEVLFSVLNTISQSPYLENALATDSLLRNDNHAAESFFFFKYQYDSLTYWSDNSVPLPENFNTLFHNKQAISLPNGIFFYRDTLIAQNHIIGLLLIKRNYPYQNIYLENRFAKDFSVPPSAQINFTEGDYNIRNKGGDFLFSLMLPENIPPAKLPSYVLLLLYALAFLTISASVFQLHSKYGFILKSKLLTIIAFSIDIILLRLIMFYFRVPSILYKSDVFRPGSFAASDFIPSMGDLFFNALTLLIISFVVFLAFKNTNLVQKKHVASRFFLIFTMFLHIFIFYRLFLMAAESIIFDSTYSLNLNQLFFLSADSFLALGVFTILLFSFFLVSFRILGLTYFYSKKSFIPYFLFLILTGGIYLIICQNIHGCNLLLYIPLVIYILAFYILTSGNVNLSEIRFTSLVFYLFLFSIMSTAVLSYYNDLKEIEQRKLLAIELSSGEDPLTEYIFHTACEGMKSDKQLKSLLSMAPYDEEQELLAIDYIQDNYLSDRLQKYEWIITICTPDRSLIIQPDGYLVNCVAYFNDIIDNLGRKGLGDYLYRYGNEAGMSNYISNQHYVLNEGIDTITVFIELYSFFIPEEGLGYPELLIDEKIKTFSGLENYSYARYKDGNLVFKYGDYPYSTNISFYMQDTTDVFFNHNNSNHYISKIKNEEYLIISKEEAGFLGIIAPFSYLLILFAAFVLIFLICIHLPFTRTQFELNFRNRLQLYIISLIIVSFIIVGVIMVRYVINLNTSKNQEILREKTHSVLIELEHKLAGSDELNPDMQEYLTNLLIKFSQVFFSDINLYDLQGQLLASSRPEIFQKKLISSRMNATAYRILTVDKKLLFVHTETIGDQDYFSAYVPFMNEDNHVIAYLNLPYFARQTELQNEISVFLNAFMNVYVLMIAVAIFIALLISRYITRPLQLIRDKMGTFSLKGSNEKIKWSKKDEIGTLVAEYNRMIDELSRSAELLAKSERETAWREMAKQVAHEIKNPLTPMKLSVQYLQKAWDEKTPDWDKRLKRFTQTIIEHIDTLSAIASSFSDFAKMPQKKAAKTDISESIKSALDLFSDIENIHFTYNTNPDKFYYVFADKTQLIRVFNNLIQNSVQAIGQENDGIIDISLEKNKNNYVIRVTDNGPGIPNDMIDKIFSPSFTTKSGGMGLGLALVKSIILEAGGEISFESSPEKGTIFIITLPAYQD